MSIIIIPLWPKGSSHNPPADQPQPRLEVYVPDVTPSMPLACVMVCPGGGYEALANHECAPVANLFTDNGLIGAVLYYRVAPNKFPMPQADACRGMRLLRENASRLNLDPKRIAIMGFSAGGHLAASVAAQPDLHHDAHDDLIKKWSARPDRAILAYPVISFGEFGHMGSVWNLIGNPPDQKMVTQLSNEKHVTENHPPTFLFHTADDGPVPVENSLMYSSALSKVKVPVELHIYEHGSHGVGLALDNPELRGWSKLLIDWLKPWRD